MSREKARSTRTVDALYNALHRHYDSDEARADGYRYQGYFEAEQKILLSLLADSGGVTIDVGCGSGLMVSPLLPRRELLVGLDFNFDACRAAAANGLSALRADAFSLPLRPDSVDEIVTCQAFNTFEPQSVARFIHEAGRVLSPGGRLVMVWRSGAALVHRLALIGLTAVDKLFGRPCFPLVDHSINEIAATAETAGLVVERRLVTFPPLGWQSANTDGILARLIGASAICIARKP